MFGVGAGWNIEELRDHGTDPKTRGALLDERIEAIKALWTTEPAEYHGKYVDFDPSYSRPKPVQKPHPPIFIGGDSDATVKRVIRHDAGWISNPLPVEPLSKRIDQMRDGAGHDVPLGNVRHARRIPTTGAPSRIWVSVRWRCCCPPSRSTNHCDCSTSTPRWSISIAARECLRTRDGRACASRRTEEVGSLVGSVITESPPRPGANNAIIADLAMPVVSAPRGGRTWLRGVLVVGDRRTVGDPRTAVACAGQHGRPGRTTREALPAVR